MDIQVTEFEEIFAVWTGELEGFYYTSDDEAWADIEDLARWRAQQSAAQKKEATP